MEVSAPRGSTAILTQILCLSSFCPHCPDIFVTLHPNQGQGRDGRTPHQPRVTLGHHHLLTGWLAPGHASPRHLLSAVQDAPAALGRSHCTGGEASGPPPCRPGCCGLVLPEGTPSGAPSEARALAQRQATCALCRHGAAALATTHCHCPCGPPGLGLPPLLGCCTDIWFTPSPLHARAHTRTHCLSSRSLES